MSIVSEEKKRSAAKSASRKRPAAGLSLSPARLKKMIKKLMDNLETDGVSNKGSVSELLKLLQIYKELTAEQVKEVEVRWVDRLREDDTSGK